MLSRVAMGIVALALLLPSTGSLAPGLPPAPEGQIPNEIIVAFEGAVPDDVEGWAHAYGGQLLMRDDVLNWVSLRFVDQAAADRAIEAALLRGDVRAAEHDGWAQISLTPNDPLYGSQWGWAPVHAPEAWDVQRGSHAVKVAVIDTGVDFGHPDLAPNICGPHASFVTGRPTAADDNGHGTHVSGTIAAVLDNGVGVAGMSQSCLMEVKVCNSGGSCQWTWIASGIRFAADNGADILSMSLGGSLAPSILRDAVFYAHTEKGALIVAAAGNGGCNGAVAFPAIYTDVIAVASLATPTTTSGFSQCGLKVEIAAPGSNVLSTWLGGGYVSISGTSMATPHVSGVAALVLAQHPTATNHQLRCALDLSATDVGLAGRDINTGWGRVDALGALQKDAQLSALPDVAADALCIAAGVPLGWVGGVPDAPAPVATPI